MCLSGEVEVAASGQGGCLVAAARAGIAVRAVASGAGAGRHLEDIGVCFELFVAFGGLC